MSEPIIKGYRAAAAIGRNRIVAFDAAGAAVPANGANAKIVGVSSEVDCTNEALCDVLLQGLFEVRAGGAIAFGDILTADDEGRAVPLTGNARRRIVGIALSAGAENEIVPALIAPGLA